MLKEVSTSAEYYPSFTEVDLKQLSSGVPSTLSSFIKSLFSMSCSDSAKRKKKLLQASICHVIMHAVGKKHYISPLLLSVGLFLHQTTHSRIILDVHSSLGLSASYKQVMSFEKSAAVHVGNKFLDDVLKAEGKLPFCQWVADNFDINEDTISGENTTHVMGIIMCINAKPESIMPIDVRRLTVSNKEIVNAGSLIHYLDKYRPQRDSPLFKLQIK